MFHGWVLGGFNKILFSFEKKGGLLRSDRQMRAFANALEDCFLTDLGFEGAWYTQERGLLASNNIRERLDMGVANESQGQLFPQFRVSHLTHTFSDHCVIMVDTGYGSKQNSRWHFQFEATWLFEDSCEGEVSRLWVESTGIVLGMLAYVCTGLNRWFNWIL